MEAPGNKWKPAGKVIQFGGYFIDAALFIDGVRNHDWSQVGGVVGGVVGGEVGAAGAGAALAVTAISPIPGDFIVLASVMGAAALGSLIGGVIGGEFE